MYYIKKWSERKAVLGISIFSLFLLIFLFIFLIFGFHPAKAAKHQILNYESVLVQTNDTLWGIAEKYYSKEYGSVGNYVKEIKRCNSLTNDHIRSGSFLIVPIYVVRSERTDSKKFSIKK